MRRGDDRAVQCWYVVKGCRDEECNVNWVQSVKLVDERALKMMLRHLQGAHLCTRQD